MVARDDRLAGPLTEGLDRLGWRTVTARGPEAALAAVSDLPIEAAVVEVDGGDAELLALARELKAAAGVRRLPVMALGRPDSGLADWSYDIALAPPVHPAQAALRLEALVRAAVAEEEFELRKATLAEHGAALPAPKASPEPLLVLTVGEPAPKFLALSHALKTQNAEVVGALTAYTAFDYLHERPFDAVVLWAGEHHAEALSIAGGMRRNTRLFHVPTVLYLRTGAEVTLADAYNRGLSDVASADTPEADTAGRIISLARAYRRETAIRSALGRAQGSGLMDAATGLFTRELFAAHLSRLAQASRERRRPLSIAVLKLAEKPSMAPLRSSGWVDRAIPQIGSMIARLVRSEDTAARLAPELFALALPAASLGEARTAAERIAAVIGCTAFEAGEGARPFTVEFDIGVAELEGEEAAARTLERAAARTSAKAAV